MHGELKEKVARIIEAELVFCLTSEPDASVEIDNAGHVADAILSAIQGEAQPVAQTASITCAHEPYQGSCAHCGIRFVNGRPHPAPEQAGEVERLRGALSKQNESICQTLGQALGYPWFKDDQANFPGSTEEHGVCVGDHVAESLADEAARRILVSEQALADMKAERDAYRVVAVNQGWNWKLCATYAEEDSYRAHREQHVDDCAVAVRTRLSKGAGE